MSEVCPAIGGRVERGTRAVSQGSWWRPRAQEWTSSASKYIWTRGEEETDFVVGRAAQSLRTREHAVGGVTWELSEVGVRLQHKGRGDSEAGGRGAESQAGGHLSSLAEAQLCLPVQRRLTSWSAW